MALMTGREALMELLRNEGVKYIFGLPGATEVLFMDALEKCHDIKYVLGLNEIVCAGMAEGYARASGKVGVLNLHTISGLAAAMPMLDNAYKGRVPLVITAGQQKTGLLIQDAPLSGELVRMASQVTKWSTEVLNASDIPIAIQRAFKMAIQPPTGPVFISLPQDVLDQSLDFEYIPDMQVYTQLRPDQNAIVKAAELLAKAVTPTIIVETGVARNDALFEVVRLAELTGARVYQPWMSDVNFPVSHPQYMGDLDLNSPKGKDILQTVDVLIVVGCQLFGVTPILSRNIQVIQIDDDPKEIAKNFPVTVGIQGNIKSSLIELTDILQKNMSMNEKKSAFTRVENIAKEKEEISITLREKADQERDNVPISISRLMHDLKNSLEPETLIVDDCWSSSATLRCTLDLNKSCSYYRARGGSIGWGLSGAIGVKLGAPNHPVVALCGDGSAMWSIQSLWTAAHYNIQVTYIVIANRSYRQVKIMRKMLIGGKLNERHAGMDLDEPAIDFCQLAQAMGIKGKSVDKPENLKKALKLALGSNQPRLVEVQVENTP